MMDRRAQADAEEAAGQLYSPATLAKAFGMWVLLFVSLPLSPFFLVATIVYQVGCVSGKLSPTSRVATFVICVFFAIAWIPFLCLIFFMQLSAADRADRGLQLDGILPLGTLVVFYLWGSVVALRVYSIDDSYEEERDRGNVRRLQKFPLEPPIMFRSRQHDTESELRDAFDLYLALKRENPENATAIAVCVGLVLSAITMTAARLVQLRTSDTTLYRSEPTYSLSTVYFSGMFLVFFSTLAFVATLYVNHVRIVWQLTFLASGDSSLSSNIAVSGVMNGSNLMGSPMSAAEEEVTSGAGPGYHEAADTMDATAPGGPLDPNKSSVNGFTAISGPTFRADEDFMRNQLSVGGSVIFRNTTDIMSSVGGITVSMQPYNIGHIRAWDEVRRVAAAYIASPDSTLNAFLTPTLWLAVLGMVAAYIYLIVSLLVNFASIGPFVVASIALLVIFAMFFGSMVIIAKKARRHFKFHSVIISRVVFDVACEIDSRLPFVQQGIERLEDRRPGMEHMELPDLERLHDSLLALLSFMDSTSPRPLIIGIEQRHVRYAVAYALLGSANVLFIALLNAIVSNRCFGDETGTPAPSLG